MTPARKKSCNKCGTEKYVSEFSPHSGGEFGRHGTCKACRREQASERYRTNPEPQWAANQRYILKRFGWTVADYTALHDLQAGKCALCSRVPVGRRLHLDHDHETNEVRGILCAGCNVALGNLGDSIEGLERAIAYLKSPPARLVRCEA